MFNVYFTFVIGTWTRSMGDCWCFFAVSFSFRTGHKISQHHRLLFFLYDYYYWLNIIFIRSDLFHVGVSDVVYWMILLPIFITLVCNKISLRSNFIDFDAFELWMCTLQCAIAAFHLFPHFVSPWILLFFNMDSGQILFIKLTGDLCAVNWLVCSFSFFFSILSLTFESNTLSIHNLW